jgi:superfamily II RNA helicase
MVFICPTIYDSENENKYIDNYNYFPYELDHFQKWAIEAIETNKHLLITAHTGSGKSMPFEYAIQKYCIKENKKIIYTSPIKSLSNQKYHELTKKYPSVSFGILTGDIKFNPEAQCIIMTTEILRNTLFQMETIESFKNNNNDDKVEDDNDKNEDEDDNIKLMEKLESTLQFTMDIKNELACVVFDEVHYINDEDRGKVWEETIMKLPKYVQLIMLSATIDKSVQFAKWIEEIKCREVWLASTNIRVVPLTHYSYQIYPQSLLKTIKEKDKSGTIEKLMLKQNNKLHTIRENNGQFYDDTIINLQKVTSFLSKNRMNHIKKRFIFNSISTYLKDNLMLPAICFTFSRKNVELYASEIELSLFDEINYPEEAKYSSIVEKECKHILMKLPNYREYMELQEYTTIVELMKKGVGIHHSGILPVFREMIELMFEKGFIKLLFATETFAVGINMPTKTVLFSGLTKYTKGGFRYLLPHEYTQMAGRAGRRGLDTIGNVIHLNGMFELPLLSEYKQILCGKPQTLISKFQCHYNLILKLFSSSNENVAYFTSQSMSFNELQLQKQHTQETLNTMKKTLQDKEHTLTLLSTKTSDLKLYEELQEKLQYSKNKQRKLIERQIETMQTSLTKSFTQDYQKYLEYKQLKDDVINVENELKVYDNYYNEKINNVIHILEDNEFINNNNNLTEKGIIASNIQEVNSLVFAELLYNNILGVDDKNITYKELAMLFSCYNNVKVKDEYKVHFYNGTNTFFKYMLEMLEKYNTKYYNIELKEMPHDFQADIYEYNMDLCQDVEKWCEAEDEETCKGILSSLYSREIFLGEFIKTILKINNIAMEIQKVCEITENYELLSKMITLREKTLKYVVTNQSLYI